jgi:potassium efflux system protein
VKVNPRYFSQGQSPQQPKYFYYYQLSNSCAHPLMINFKRALEIFITPLFSVGETAVSIALILQLLFWLVAIFIACRLLRAFLSQRLFVRLGINKGNREAIATIVTYFVGFLSLLVVLQAIGFQLASLAVLAGALGVGIGFGLQDITKNFVSGLTLLVERSLKVDDFIVFDGMDGYVVDISLRSTVIRTREGEDVIVPNSQLVESRVVNWSYENYRGRLHIPVGVAYESDPLLVTETLLKSAYMEPAVRSEPAPDVMFVGFGDSSLNFELRVWVDRIDHDVEIISSLNYIIEYNLRQQGIQIPFPQRDLWLRNPETLAPVVHRSPQQSVSSLPPSETTKPLSIRDLLRQINYFENFTDLDLRLLIEVGYRKRLRTEEILFHEGSPGDAFYMILAGSVEVFAEKINKHLTTLNPGQFFGELSLLLGIPRTATVRALEPTTLFLINRRGFEKLLKNHPELSEVIIQALGKYQEELKERQQQLRELGLVDAEEDDKNPLLWVRKRVERIFSL